MEIIQLPRRLHIINWKRHMTLIGGRELLGTLLSGRPAMLVTGHLGNWEMSGFALGLFGFKSYAVARPIDNPYLDKFLCDFRERTGQKVLAQKGDFEQMQEVLARAGTIAPL